MDFGTVDWTSVSVATMAGAETLMELERRASNRTSVKDKCGRIRKVDVLLCVDPAAGTCTIERITNYGNRKSVEFTKKETVILKSE